MYIGRVKNRSVNIKSILYAFTTLEDVDDFMNLRLKNILQHLWFIHHWMNVQLDEKPWYSSPLEDSLTKLFRHLHRPSNVPNLVIVFRNMIPYPQTVQGRTGDRDM